MRENEITLEKKCAAFYTKGVKFGKIAAMTPWAPGLTGMAIGEKLLGMESLWGDLLLTNQRVRFCTTPTMFSEGLGKGKIDFSIELRDIQSVDIGRKALRKTIIVRTNNSQVEFSMTWGASRFVEKLAAQLSSIT